MTFTDNNITVQNVPFIGDMVFNTVSITWGDIINNPLYSGTTKSVGYYLNKDTSTRQTKHKIQEGLKSFFLSHPSYNTPENLNMELGKFILKVKTDGVMGYKGLVNPNGDNDRYINYKIHNLTPEKGIYIWLVDGKPVYVGIAGGSKGLENRINREYGSITEYKCTSDGQPQTCGNNIKVLRERELGKEVTLMICPVDTQKFKNNPQFMEYMDGFGFKGTRVDKNILEVFEKFIIEEYNFKGEGWNGRM